MHERGRCGGAGPTGAGGREGKRLPATIRVGSEEAGTNGGKDEATVDKTDGAVIEWRGGRTGRSKV
jgi:hypothetical protein